MKCKHCGSTNWDMSSPSYDHSPAQYAHYCPRTGRRETMYDERDTHYRGEPRTESGATAAYMAEIRRYHTAASPTPCGDVAEEEERGDAER